MVEYLYDAIRASAGNDININAIATYPDETLITEDCSLMLHDTKGKEMLVVQGNYMPDSLMWEFIIPAEATRGLKGRYWYCIKHKTNNLCFLQPIYLV